VTAQRLKFKLKPPTRKERDVLQAVKARLSLAGWLVIRLNNGAGFAEHNGKQRFFRFTSEPGIADLLECKAPRGHQSPQQKLFELKARSFGCRYLLVDSLERLELALREAA
jgi:hypothetical protein